jgi:hypothetical protein
MTDNTKKYNPIEENIIFFILGFMVLYFIIYIFWITSQYTSDRVPFIKDTYDSIFCNSVKKSQ